MDVELIPLKLEHAEMVLNWRNSPSIYALGSQNRRVGISEHYRWMESATSGKLIMAFVIRIGRASAGLIRFEKVSATANVCFVSIYLIDGYSGKGHGVTAIREGCCRIRQVWGTSTKVLARIRTNNFNSQRAFVKAGFAIVDEDNEHQIYEYAPNGI